MLNQKSLGFLNTLQQMPGPPPKLSLPPNPVDGPPKFLCTCGSPIYDYSMECKDVFNYVFSVDIFWFAANKASKYLHF